MASNQASSDQHALVTVFDDLDTAKRVVTLLHVAGIPIARMELLIEGANRKASEIETPKHHETTNDSFLKGFETWGAAGMGTGAAAGILAAVVTPFPGLIVGTIIAAGLTGAFIGGIAGVEHAVLDDSVDLPTQDEYKQLLRSGHYLVVVRGAHGELESAKHVILETQHVSSHLHPLHGHIFHEHPTQQSTRDPQTHSSDG